MRGKIVKGIAGFYYVWCEDDKLYECKAKGSFRKEGIKPLVGDNVTVCVLDEEKHLGNLEEILPRKNELIRPAVANVDQALIVFAMANPTPEIMPDEAKAGGVRVMATGRSDFPNQVNNVLCFPGLFKGALSVRARDINNEMKLAAAYAIADLITDADRSEENIIPGAFDPRVAEAVANAVAKAARETGVARL